MDNQGWLRLRALSAATQPARHRRDRRRRSSAFGFGTPRPEGLEDRTLLSNSPIVTTQAASGLGSTTATLNGTVNPDGTTTDTSFEYATNRYLAPNVVTTLAGTAGTGGSTDATGAAASFDNPQAVAVDPTNGDVYVADTGNDTVRMITPAGVVTTLAGTAGTAGSTDGTGAAASFSGPQGIAVDPTNGNVYVADTGNDTVRMITPAGVVTTLAGTAGTAGSTDGTGAAASFNGPKGVTVDPTTGNVYVGDTGNDTIRMITSAGVVTTLAGTAGTAGSTDGTGAAASFNAPAGVAVDPTTGSVYVADSVNNSIRSITSAGAVTTLVSGINDDTLYRPQGVTVDPTTGDLFVSDLFQTVHLITPTGMDTTLAGQLDSSGSTDGIGTAATFSNPTGVAFDSTTDSIYVADSGNETIRLMSLSTVEAQTGLTGTTAQPANAQATGLLPNTTYYYRAVATGTTSAVNGNILSFTTPASNAPIVTTQSATNVAGTTATLNGTVNPNGGTAAGAFEISTNPYLVPNVVTTFAGTAGTTGSNDATGAAASFDNPQAVAVDPANGDVYVADTTNDTIRMITPAGVVTTLAGTAGTVGSGDGTGAAASFNHPAGIAVDPTTGDIYVADTGNDTIRMITSAGVVTTLAGTAGTAGSGDGTGTEASFSGPQGVAVDPTTGNVYVADTGNDTIRMITSASVVTTLAGTAGTAGSADGTGSAAGFSDPTGVAVDTNTGNVYVADTGNDTIRMITPAGVVTTLAGKAGTAGSADGTGSAASFSAPKGVTTDPTTGFVYVADSGNSTIRMIAPAGVVSTLVGTAGTTGSADGTGSAASFNDPTGLAFDSANDTIFVADAGNDTIRELSLNTVAAQSGLTGSTAQSISAAATGLQPSTTYYYRAVATPSTGGAINGDIMSFTTTSSTTVTAPTATTQAATSIAGTTATLNGIVNPQGGATSAQFVYGTDSTLTTDTTSVPIPGLTIGSGTSDVLVIEPITGLNPSTTYYYQIVATNSGGTTDGDILSFTTTASTVTTPTITTGVATNVTSGTATLNATVNPNGVATTVHFIYGTTTTLSSGTLTTADQSIGSGTSPVSVTAALTGLTPGATYYYEPVATSNGVTTAGPIQSLTTAVTTGPTITNLQRYGYHTQPTEFVLTFDSALNPTAAQDVKNYTITAMTGSNAGGKIPISSAVYNATNHTVTLKTVDRVYLYDQYRITVNGTSPSGVSNSSGQFLAGQNGQAGTNFVQSFGEEILAGPDLTAAMSRARRAQIEKAWPHNRAYAARITAQTAAKARNKAEVGKVHHVTTAVKVHPTHLATAGAAVRTDTHTAAIDAAISEFSAGKKQHRHGRG